MIGELIGGLIGAGESIIGGINAASDRRRLNDLIKNRPRYNVNAGYYQNVNDSQSAYNGIDKQAQYERETADQDFSTVLRNIQMSGADIDSQLGAATNSQVNLTRQKRGIAGDAYARRLQNLDRLRSDRQSLGEENDKAWNYNINEPYQNQVAAARDALQYDNNMTTSGLDMFGVSLVSGLSYLGDNGKQKQKKTRSSYGKQGVDFIGNNQLPNNA